jgi:hypothetical protein
MPTFKSAVGRQKVLRVYRLYVRADIQHVGVYVCSVHVCVKFF